METTSVQVSQPSAGLLYSFSMSMLAVIVTYRIGASFKLFDAFWGFGIGAFFFFSLQRVFRDFFVDAVG